MESLLQGLVSNVLSRLPAKELMQRKCVCKSWFDLITDPHFTSNYFGELVRQFITLPRSQLIGREQLIIPSQPNLWSRDLYYCFGFDPITSDKLAVLKDLRLRGTVERIRGGWTVKLYGFNFKFRRNIGANFIPFPFEICDSSLFCTYVNNCYHWWGYVPSSQNHEVEHLILSFDVVNKLFRKIKVPQITYSSGPCSINLAAFTESATIGLIAFPKCGVTTTYICIDVWMMKDYKDDGSWIKQYNIGPLPIILMHFMDIYWSNQFPWKDTINTLDLIGDDYEEYRTRVLFKGNQSIIAVRYMESLVLLQMENESRWF